MEHKSATVHTSPQGMFREGLEGPSHTNFGQTRHSTPSDVKIGVDVYESETLVIRISFISYRTSWVPVPEDVITMYEMNLHSYFS